MIEHPATLLQNEIGAAVDLGRHLAIAIVGTSEAELIEVPETGPVHLRARIKSAEYAMHGLLCQTNDGSTAIFEVPRGLENTLILGIVPIGLARYQVFDLDWDTVVELGVESGPVYRITVGGKGSPWREITTFAKRL